MEGIRTKHNTQHGCVRYLDYDTQEGVNIQIDDPMVLQQNGYTYMRVKMVDGELVYNRFGEGWDSTDEPLTQSQLLEVGTSAAISVGNDINTLQTINQIGSKAYLDTSSTVDLLPGTYRIELSAAFDFSSENGYAQIGVYNHDGHALIVSPAIKSSVYVYAQHVTTFFGHNSNSFVFNTGSPITICFRPIALAGVDSLTYFSAVITRV